MAQGSSEREAGLFLEPNLPLQTACEYSGPQHCHATNTGGSLLCFPLPRALEVLQVLGPDCSAAAIRSSR